ncbi:MAG: hypothetical protein WCZ43_00825 [Proteiniphilum sp.]
MVVDYNDLSKMSVIYTDKVRGGTNGYHTPTQYVNEAGEILQMVSGANADSKNEVHIVKIKNGEYDETFDYNLSTKLGKESKSNGWFYAGNGIGHIYIFDVNSEGKDGTKGASITGTGADQYYIGIY